MKHTNLYTIAESMVAKLFNEDIEDVEKEHGITAHKPNPVVQQDEVKYADDYVQYTNKPGVIVAIVKGNTYSGIQQIPIGAVDNFRFMKITDEDAFMSQKDLANENETSKRYENLVQEYERSKSEVIEQWRKNNANTYNSLKSKYGNKLLGADIIQNDKRIQHKDDEVEKGDNDEVKKDDKNKELYNSGNDRQDDKSIDETEQVDEGIFLRSSSTQKSIKQMIDIAAKIRDNDIDVNNVQIKARTIDKDGGHPKDKNLKGMVITDKAGWLIGGSIIGFVTDERLTDDERKKILITVDQDSRRINMTTTGSLPKQGSIDKDMKEKNWKKYKVDISNQVNDLTFNGLREILIKSGVKRISQNLKGIFLIDRDGYIISRDILGVELTKDNTMWFGFEHTKDEKIRDDVFT